jgi:triphosphoribosyl-dephospho-CoA synthase
VLASPGGLGRADRHDVSEPATVTLRQAMAEAADRDRIAHQYVTDFGDILDRADGMLAPALLRWSEPRWATLAVYLDFLSAYPDSHVVREHGMAAAEQVRLAATAFHRRLLAAERPAALTDDLLGWDKVLKDAGLNPGTSADLTVATLFAHRLTNSLPSAPNSG